MKTVLVALALVGMTGRAESASSTAPVEPEARLRRRADGLGCCRVTIVDPRTRTVTAVDGTTGRAFQFKVADDAALSSLKVGQPISANFDTNVVILDGLGEVDLIPALYPRFEARCGGDCVKDRWTGYIWQSSPNPMAHSRSQARNVCSSFNSVHPPDGLTTEETARERGWSMPYIWELATFPDPTLPGSAVPPNLFFDVKPGAYWALGGTTGGGKDLARVFGTPFGGVGTVSQSVNLMVWCVLSSWTTGTVIVNP
jgi:Cu/Ag efflux protein CusF